MARFVVRERPRPGRAATEYLVVDTDNSDLPVASFDDRGSAEEHVERLAAGPFDWDEQDQWQDDW